MNDAADASGETKYGISSRSYPAIDIASLTLEDAKAVYRLDFWDLRAVYFRGNPPIAPGTCMPHNQKVPVCDLFHCCFCLP